MSENDAVQNYASGEVRPSGIEAIGSDDPNALKDGLEPVFKDVRA